jgi:hypothetical protein
VIQKSCFSKLPTACRLFLSDNPLDAAQTNVKFSDIEGRKSDDERRKIRAFLDGGCQITKSFSLLELSIEPNRVPEIEDSIQSSEKLVENRSCVNIDSSTVINHTISHRLIADKDLKITNLHVPTDKVNKLEPGSLGEDSFRLPPVIECCLRGSKACAICPVRFLSDYRVLCKTSIVRGHPGISTIERVCSPRCWARSQL